MERRVVVQWTEPAQARLNELPRKVQRNILSKTAALADTDPRSRYKSLGGRLEGCCSFRAGRYRVIYTVKDDELANGDVLVLVRVVIVAVGKRQAGNRSDVYALAERLVRFAERRIDEFEGGQDADL